MKLRNRHIWTLSLTAVFAFTGQAAHAVNPVVLAPCSEYSTADESSSPALTTAVLDAVLKRQMKAWQTQDFSPAAKDWLPDGLLISPGGQVKVGELPAVIKDYAAHFGDLHVKVTRSFLSQDAKSAVIQWDWEVTRKRDGKHGITHDAIIVDFEGAKIKTWHEFFDLGNSVDANP